MSVAAQTASNRPLLGIGLILAGIMAISVNDMLIKQLSSDYPLHQMVFIRSFIGLMFIMVMIQAEGGLEILKTRQPALHILRGLLVVVANMTFFAALAVLPLGEATALFFVAPLFITLLSIPILGEQVGIYRIGAVAVGFIGVLIMQRPWVDAGELETGRMVLLLPVVAAFTYALMQLLTRKLGVQAKASAMAAYIQFTFLVVGGLFWLVAGDGRFADGVENESMVFLLRAWSWPQGADIAMFIGLGMNSAIVAYCLSAAYRAADAATIAPYEYVGLPLAVFWGWMIWSDLPGIPTITGIALIVGAGLFVFLRERQKKRLVASRRANRRY